MAVDHVIGEEHRDLQPAVLHRRILQRTVLATGDGVERTADVARGDLLEDLRLGHFRADADQAQLADFFLERHLLHQVGNKRLLVLLRLGSGIGKGGMAGQADKQAQQTEFVHDYSFSRLRAVFIRETAQPKLGEQLLL